MDFSSPARSAVTDAVLEELAADELKSGGPVAPEPGREGAIGATMFDAPGSEDGSVTVLLPQGSCQAAASQSLVRIVGRGDGRNYLGIVTAGPFAEPDSLRADSHMLVTVATRGGALYLPPYHGRVQVTLLGEELADGTLAPPRFRPLPNSPVHVLSPEDSARVLRTTGDIELGLVVGHEQVALRVPSTDKAVLPRHLAVLGTTGGGKSTTIARLIREAQAADMAVVVLDVEGEYTQLHLPTDDPKMLAGLKERGLEPSGLSLDRMTVHHLIGRDPATPEHPNLRTFSLQFARLSPYAASEILGLSEAQDDRFFKAYDLAKELLRELEIFPKKGDEKQQRMAMELDEFQRGYPRLTLQMMVDVVNACHEWASASRGGGGANGGGRRKRAADEDAESEETPSFAWNPRTPEFATSEARNALLRRMHAARLPGNAVSWRALLGRLGRLNRMKVFDQKDRGARPMSYEALLRPGATSIIDLSDSGASELNNLVIADLLRGVQDAQDKAYRDYERGRGEKPGRVLLVIEEAHEFLSEERIDRMPHLFEQVARVAKRGRKRGLGLAFVTQLPQHLPRQVLGLVNSYVLHKITDAHVVAGLKRSVAGIDEALWSRLPGLAPGQAIASFPHMARPLLASIHPTPGRLRLVD